ncbi:DUF1853 family protein [Gimesia sp.]|uniref:DUF1853 family protein n=1 Tax=Gimesia sp. TaxID=2024833 RepID=UPI003A92FB8A
MKPEKHHPNDVERPPSRILRDLHWAITSPALISSSPQVLSLVEELDLSLIDVEELQEFITPYSRFRVGEYFEGLVLYWLERIRKLKIIAQHQQLFAENQTVGEIDFLFEDAAGELNHWETAVKFYLYYPHENQTGSSFIGPNAKDTFERKRRRLFEHQLPLSETHFPEVAHRVAFVKGIIFYHPHHTPPTQLPGELSPAHLKGVWLYHSELDWLEQQSGATVYQIREKPDWLSPAVCDPNTEKLLTFSELKQSLAAHFQEVDRPLMISVLKQNEHDYREIKRLFVVSETWPEQA